MTRSVRTAIIGSGFAGLGAAIRLLNDGHRDVTIFERDSQVGGTWRDNTYPGAACDIPSVLYSLSTSPNPNWTRFYPGQAEIQDYLVSLVDRHDLHRHLRLNTTISELRFNTGLWELTLANGETEEFDAVIIATGALNKPSIPLLDGIDTFAGTVFHSAQWNHDHDLSDRRVAVVGTGASAIQIAPAIAGTVDQLIIFQRTAPWVIPRPDRALTDRERHRFARYPFSQKLVRGYIWALQELTGVGFVGRGRSAKAARRFTAAYGRKLIAKQITDPALRRQITPDYEPGCKRILSSNDWYPTLNRSNVSLATEAIIHVEPNGIRTADGILHDVDTIVLATGFRTTELLVPLKVFGVDGRELSESWRDGNVASHLGISVRGYPNLFLVTGPGTGVGHNSFVFMIEAAVNYAALALRELSARPGTALDISDIAQERSTRWMTEHMKRTVWTTGCTSWYQRADGSIDTLWPGYTWQYWLRTRRFSTSDYTVLTLSPEVAERFERAR